MSGFAIYRPGLTEGVLWRRFWAWLIDALLIGILASAVWAVLFTLGLVTLGLGFGLMALLPIIPVAYHTLFVASARCATPGQSFLGLVVLRNGDFGRPDLLQALIFTLILDITLTVGVWPLLLVFVTERRRALHDIVSGLVVVRREALNAEALTPSPGFANMGRP